MKRLVSLLMALCLVVGLTACGGDTSPADSAPTSDTVATTDTTGDTTATTTLPQSGGLDTLRFVGRIVESDGSAVLMECEDDCTLGDTVWVQLGHLPDFVPQIGQVYTVTYEDMVMLSMPPRVNALAMTPVSASATDAATEEKTKTTVTEEKGASSTSVVSGTIATFVAADSSVKEETSTTATVASSVIGHSTAATQAATSASSTVTTQSISATSKPTTPPPPLGTLDTALAKDIKETMVRMDPEVSPHYTEKDVWLTYYGTYDGCIVVSVFAPFLAADNVRWDETVGGQVFTSVCAYDLYVWRDGEFFMLRDAYKKGWITDAHLRDLAYYWNGNYGKAVK